MDYICDGYVGCLVAERAFWGWNLVMCEIFHLHIACDSPPVGWAVDVWNQCSIGCEVHCLRFLACSVPEAVSWHACITHSFSKV